MTTVAPASGSSLFTDRQTGGFAVHATHLTTLIAQIEQKSRSRVVAVRVPGVWSGGELLQIGEHSWRVTRATSVLAVREALVQFEDAGPDARLILLTPLDTQDLGWDVLARIAKQRVLTLEPWELLQDVFRARSVDPRVATIPWLADVLLEHAPAAGYAPAPSGVLDLDTAWTHALSALLGIHGNAPDPLTILRWSLRDAATARWARLSTELRQGVGERMAETAGDLGRVFASVLNAERGDQLVSLGLVCDVLWPEQPLQDPSIRDILTAARVRLEPLVGGTAPSPGIARDWATLARRALAELPADRAATQRARAERLLEEVRAERAAVLSRDLPSGAVQRGARLANAITSWLAGATEVVAAGAALYDFVEHDDVRGTARAERAMMAMRLVRALSAIPDRDGPAPAGFGALVRLHVGSASWFDMARTMLLAGDVQADLAAAYAALLRRARQHRESENQRFAERLTAWNTHPVAEPDIIPVERVIEQIVAPVADARPVLVVVMDGLDLVVWRQLVVDLANRGWTRWRPDTASIAPVAVATLPSVTAFSRMSLFAGHVVAGTQAQEAQQFPAHPALARSVVAGHRPILVHKAALGGPKGLAAEVRRTIADRQQRVVGAVINAVDDWLDKSDQVTPRWSVTAIPLFEALLQEAALAERAVIILSDHGHLLDYDTTLARGSESARWRTTAVGPAGTGEITARGARVRAATGQDEIVLAWSEALRYTGKKTGYHGGASPQEVIAPIAVLSRDELGLAGWRPVLDAAPVWWHDDTITVPVPSERTARATLVEMYPFVEEPTVAASTADIREGTWADEVLASPVYDTQRVLAGRTAPRDDQLRALLDTLHASNGRASRTVVANALGLSEMRMRGVLAGARRVLNVEGFAVLGEEEATGTLMLNVDLLRVQFGLDT